MKNEELEKNKTLKENEVLDISAEEKETSEKIYESVDVEGKFVD